MQTSAKRSAELRLTLYARMKRRLLLVGALSLPKPLALFSPYLVTTQT